MNRVIAVNVTTDSSNPSANSTTVRKPRNSPAHGLGQSSAKGVAQVTKSAPHSASATSADAYSTSVMTPGSSPNPYCLPCLPTHCWPFTRYRNPTPRSRMAAL